MTVRKIKKHQKQEEDAIRFFDASALTLYSDLHKHTSAARELLAVTPVYSVKMIREHAVIDAAGKTIHANVCKTMQS